MATLKPTGEYETSELLEIVKDCIESPFCHLCPLYPYIDCRGQLLDELAARIAYIKEHTNED